MKLLLSRGDKIANEITRELKRREADPKINKTIKHGEIETKPLFMSGATNTGKKISVCYVSYQGGTKLSYNEAERYLEFLKANPNKIIKHHEIKENT